MKVCARQVLLLRRISNCGSSLLTQCVYYNFLGPSNLPVLMGLYSWVYTVIGHFMGENWVHCDIKCSPFMPWRHNSTHSHRGSRQEEVKYMPKLLYPQWNNCWYCWECHRWMFLDKWKPLALARIWNPVYPAPSLVLYWLCYVSLHTVIAAFWPPVVIRHFIKNKGI